MELSADEIVNWWVTLFYPFCRVAALITAAPILGTRAVSARIRIVLAVAVSVVMVPVSITGAALPLPWTPAGSLATAAEVATGLALGLSLRVVFMALEIAGSLIAQLMGLSFSSMVDPASGAEVPVIGQLNSVLASLLYLSLDAHLVLFRILGESFAVLPAGGGEMARIETGVMLTMLDGVFAAGVIMALPISCALLIVNLGFGVLSRVAPQMNIFAVGLPISALFGVVLLLLGTADLLRELPALFDWGLAAARSLLVVR
jgi:flagellar biosynthetic protein FliR